MAYSIAILGLFLASLAPSGAVRQLAAEKESAEVVSGVSEKEVCCCRVELNGYQKCSGNLKEGSGRRYFYDAVTHSRSAKDDAKSHTCFEKALCCHTFKGACQVASPFAFKERYSMANVDPTLCTALPEVAESLFTATPTELFGEDAFLGAIKGHTNKLKKGFMARDYTIIIDRSGSMSAKDMVQVPEHMARHGNMAATTQSLSRWRQVEMAVEFLAPYVIEEDPDGVSVLFFDNGWDEHENVRTVREVNELFQKNSPGGRTYLAEPLVKAMEPDTIGRAETIFVITDGAASDPSEVTRAIVEKSHALCRPELLSISFIQVGNDHEASSYLSSLDDDLLKANYRARFDIVDALTTEEMHGRSFLEVVENSLLD